MALGEKYPPPTLQYIIFYISIQKTLSLNSQRVSNLGFVRHMISTTMTRSSCYSPRSPIDTT